MFRMFIAALKESFGIGEELVTTYFHPYLYLNRKAIADRGLDLAEVERAVAQELSRVDGVALAADQVPNTGNLVGLPGNTPVNAHGGNSILYHGLNVGMEYRF